MLTHSTTRKEKPRVLVGYRLFLVYAGEHYTSLSEHLWSETPPLATWEQAIANPQVVRGKLYRRGRLYRTFDVTDQRRRVRP
jgi:hypothetical protein